MSSTTQDVVFSLGDIIWCSFKPMIKIYAILIVGFFYGRWNIFSLQTSRDVSYINLHVLLPSLIFQTIVTNLQYTDIKQIAICCFNSFLYIIISGLLITLLACFDSRTNFLILPDWKYGSTFYMMFSTGSNLMISYMQSFESYPNQFFSSANELNRGMAFIFIAFACTEFVVYNLNGQKLIQLDFDIESKVSSVFENNPCVSSDSEDKKFSKKDNIISTSANKISAGKENSETNDITDNQSLNSISSSEESETGSTRNNPVRFSNKSKTIVVGDNNDIRSLTTISTNGSSLESGIQRTTSRSSSAYKRKNGRKLRAIELRRLPSQKLDDVVDEFGALADMGRRNSKSQNNDIGNPLDLIRSASRRLDDVAISEDSSESEVSMEISNPEKASKTPFLSFLFSKVRMLRKKHCDRDSKEGIILQKPSQKPLTVAKIQIFKFLLNFLKSLLNPLILSVLISFVVAMVPWLKNLFVFTETNFEPANTIKSGIHDAPDGYPPLNVFMTFASYMGSAQAQLSLFLLGAIFSRLSFEKYPGIHFLVKIIFLAVLKLCILPIIGISWISSVYDKPSWFGNQVPQNSAIYIMCLIWALPGYSSQIFITALYTKNKNKERLVYLAWMFIIEFSLFIVTFPFVSAYVLKHMLHY